MSQCSCGMPPPPIEEPKPVDNNVELKKNDLNKVFQKPSVDRLRYTKRFKRNNEYLFFLVILLFLMFCVIYKG